MTFSSFLAVYLFMKVFNRNYSYISSSTNKEMY